MTEWLSTYRDEGLAQSSVVTSVRSEEKQPMGSLKSNSGSQGADTRVRLCPAQGRGAGSTGPEIRPSSIGGFVAHEVISIRVVSF